MDDEKKKELVEYEKYVEEKELIIKEGGIEDDIKVAYNNMLWLLYRMLAEETITTEELENILSKVR